MTVTVVMGPPCSGKSTWIQEQRATGDVVVDFDALAMALGSDATHEAPPDVRGVAAAARTAAVARCLDGLDGDGWIIWHALTAEKIADLGEKGVRFHVMDTPIEMCLERAAGRPGGTADRIKEWFANPPVVPTDYQKGAAVKTKTVTVGLKSADDLAEGQFTGYASVFGNVDSYGDVVVAGAFAESLKEYGPDGAGVPCYWSHQMSDPEMCIGQTVECREDEHGLFVKVQLDLDTAKGAQVHRLIKAGRVGQMSFAFDVEDYAVAHDDERGEYIELRRLKLHEVSVVQVGANQATELLDVKDRLTQIKAGRSLSSKNESSLKQAASLIENVLASLGDDEKSGPAEAPENSGDQPDTPQEDAPREQVKTGGHPSLALANINQIALEGAQA